ncbi:extracellular solute-binding protein [Spongiibacter tropicus]|uniref:extracellular solute-binding protein n=1 Tax=Spongiibacter tropicus TaxID=454602 RepID=UPI003A98E3A2
MKLRLLLIITTLLSVAACSRTEEPAGPQLVVYSSRIEQLIKPIFDTFSEETGVEIRYVTDSAGPLLARLQAEGENSPADILLTVDVGNLWQAAQMDLLQPIESEVLKANVPTSLHDPEERWFGLSIRARTIVYSTERVDPAELSSYEQLADPVWSGRLCLRTSKKVYNQSLVATMMVANGEEKASQIVKSWVDNLAVPPFSSDNKVIEAIAAGQCDVGLVNTYYLARMQKDNPELPVELFWANQSGEAPLNRGVHVNISGAGVTLASKQPDLAKRLLEWLSGPEAQQAFAQLNQEFPVNPDTQPSELLKHWGPFKGDDVPVVEAGRLQAEAIRLMDRAGYR